MQLATASKAGRPWLCNVWYVMDNQDNVYWISRITRRHSEDIANNPQVACTFHKPYKGGPGLKGCALVIAGLAKSLSGADAEKVLQLYAEKYPQINDTPNLEETIAGTGKHLFYRLTPQNIVWWDETEGHDNPRQVLLDKNNI